MMWQKPYKFSARSDQSSFEKKKAKNDFASFCNFAVFFTFIPREMTSKFKFDLIRPTEIGGACDLLDFTFIDHSFYLKNDF